MQGAKNAITGSSDRSFGLVFAAFFLLIALTPLRRGEAMRTWSLVLSGGFAILAFAYPRLLAPLNTLWTRIGLVMHKVMNPLILGIMFFLVFTPIGLLMRRVGKRPLGMHIEKRPSYWIEKAPQPADSFKNQF